MQKSATFHTTFEILEDKTEWLKPPMAAGSPGVRMQFRFGLALAAILVCLSTASAQQQEQASPLTLRHAIELALEKNPLRKAAIADVKVASATFEKRARS